MGNDYLELWNGLDPQLRTRLAEHAPRGLTVEDVRALPMFEGVGLADYDVYTSGAERSEGYSLDPDFEQWIDSHTTEGHYARAWDGLTPAERQAVASSDTGEAPQGTVERLAVTVGITGTYWPAFQNGPDRWNVGMAFVKYMRERLAR